MTNSKPLQTALVGCGAVARLYYTPALLELQKQDRLRVTALFDPSPANVAQLHQVFTAAAPVGQFDDLQGLDLDLAIIASPPKFHTEQTIQLLRAGVNVLCEKPMALSVSEGEAMVQAARASQRILSIGLVRRFLPAARTIRDLLNQHILGEVVSFSCDEGRVFQWPAQSAAYFQQNGVLLDIGVHVLDLLYWWWGQPEEIVYEDDAMGGVEANCRVRLRFPQGFEGEVRLSRDNQLRNMTMVRFEKGWINWELDETNKVQMGLWDSGYCLNAAIHESVSYGKNHAAPGPADQDFQQCFTAQVGNVVSAVRGHEALYIPAEEGLPSLRMIEHCYAQRSLMEMPWLSEREAARAQQLRWSGPG